MQRDAPKVGVEILNKALHVVILEESYKVKGYLK